MNGRFFEDQFGTGSLRAIFDDRGLLQSWLDAEAALARAEADVGLIPPAAALAISQASKANLLDHTAIKAGIDYTFHPIVPVVKELARVASGNWPDAGRYVHWGATTQDIMDTGTVLQLRAALNAMEPDVNAIEVAIRRLSLDYADTLMAGRTHGQHALPITFGFKTAVWLAEWRRHRQRLANARPRILVGQLGGAAGTLAGFGPRADEIQRRFCADLGLGVPDIAWHTARDGLAEAAFVLGLFAATLGKIAREVVALQKTEVGEVEEPWQIGKMGSSTMPHKRNPMLCELIVGLSQLVRRETGNALDGMLGEHERDMGPWQAEWEWIPQVCRLTSAALLHGRRVVEGLVIHPDRMRRNLDLTGGLLLSEAVMLRLADDIGREEAHDLIYEIAMRAYDTEQPFAKLLSTEPAVSDHLSNEEITRLLDPEAYTGMAATFARRVAGTSD